MKKLKANSQYESILSPLERDVLCVIWPNKTMKVREIYSILGPKRKVALSSIAVILDRLHEKGVVDRKVETGRGGIRYLYFPKQNEAQFEVSVIEKAVDSLIDKFGPTAVSYFNDRFSKRRGG
ncbi:BlaI/MecI/CopY family transcriptional regulator [Candidatus Woesearchaeota archaeon]|nr:BlaI/MecI/CopY family transcriptional regulator [Candidatus Woesearchaeota archaeon]